MTSNVDQVQSEEQLITKAQSAISQCNWVVGECAAQWTQKYAKGRTDSDFAALIGLSPDQVYQRRRVWETFSETSESYENLKWSHFYVALNWEDSPECLQWAHENEATVVEMKAWRRALRGEDLTEEAEEFHHDSHSGDPSIAFVPDTLTPVQDPSNFGGSGEGGSEMAGASRSGSASETVQAVARETSDAGYAPFSPDAKKNPNESGADHPDRVVPMAEQADQLLKKMTSTIKRLSKSLSPEMIKAMEDQPQGDLEEFHDILTEFREKVASLI
ncbi:hypothetical protein Pla110_28990 [Polystyrenella longa]|uniref:Uncharacterized protein n=1 Tax=Polystyrenella longa TaxID=2528007 RepID=A0A518CPL9_9PLAN|nr:helix-turn-helix domain-containing protein [Polystyrenella longa]QDU81162.1 hypothetical protein Pla110_28990 [Polystyrenella longa]